MQRTFIRSFLIVLALISGFVIGIHSVQAQASADGPQCDQIEYEGEGTAESPFEIGNIEELQCVKEHHNENAHWQLVDNIDASETENWNDGQGWEPIGDSNSEFRGVFDGQGHRIDNLYINRSNEEDVGLFGATYAIGGGTGSDGSTVKNIRVIDFEIYAHSHVGGVAGQIGGTLENASAEGYIEAEEQRAGILVGRGADADLTNQLAARGTLIAGDAETTDRGVGAIVGRSSWDTDVDIGYAQALIIADQHAGGIMGSTSTNPSEFDEMYSASKVVTRADNNETAGVVTGLIEDPNDQISSGVYWDETLQQEFLTEGSSQMVGEDTTGGIAENNAQSRTTTQMTGENINQSSNVGNLTFVDEGGPWIKTENDYPRFEWEVKAEQEHDQTAIFFERFDSDSVFIFLPIALVIVGLIVYKTMREDDEMETSSKKEQENDNTNSLTTVEEQSSASSITIEEYEDLKIQNHIKTVQGIQVCEATNQNQKVWVLSPESDGDTIDTEQFDAFVDRVDPWTNMDDHTNLLSIYGYGTEPLPWVAVEPADRPSLQECTRDRTTGESLKLLAEACEAVHHVQRYGLAYEHLSLESILVDNTDATLRGVLDHVTVDTAGYELPDPEEDPTTEQADVYRLGALAYEVLTGTQPTKPELTPPSEQNVSLPSEVDEILLKALAAAPDDRYETVLHLRDELREG